MARTKLPNTVTAKRYTRGQHDLSNKKETPLSKVFELFPTAEEQGKKEIEAAMQERGSEIGFAKYIDSFKDKVFISKERFDEYPDFYERYSEQKVTNEGKEGYMIRKDEAVAVYYTIEFDKRFIDGEEMVSVLVSKEEAMYVLYVIDKVGYMLQAIPSKQIDSNDSRKGITPSRDYRKKAKEIINKYFRLVGLSETRIKKITPKLLELATK